PARISPKEISGANGKFLPKPLLFHLRHPNSKKISRVFCEILSPKNSFRKTESALVPPPARILGGQNTKEKCPFLFQEKFHPRQIRKARNIFLWCPPRLCEAGGGTVHSFSFLSKKVRANAKITPPNETCSELRKRSDFAGAKIALSFFSKPFPPTAEAVNSQSSPQLKS
ncbi:MAG: hypothetical protein WDZ85_02640, partial [Candidatus Paceibacterota bacterium]